MNNYGRIYGPYSGGRYDTIYLSQSTHDARMDVLGSRLSKEKPHVFVSHKNEDRDDAEDVAKTIAASGLKVYLDIWDHNVNDGPELVDYIESIIKNSKSLIAVVSRNTVTSWWVPLEIGIAITEGLYLGTYSTTTYTTGYPSYLWKWPVLKNLEDLRKWCAGQKSATSPNQFYRTIRLSAPHLFRR